MHMNKSTIVWGTDFGSQNWSGPNIGKKWSEGPVLADFLPKSVQLDQI